MNEEKFEEAKDALCGKIVPFEIINRTNHRSGAEMSAIQSMSGEYYIWEMARNQQEGDKD